MSDNSTRRGHRFKDLSGKKVHRLLVVRLHEVKERGKNKHKVAFWECRCDCGTICFLPASSLIGGHTKSCGCFFRERIKVINKTHGMAHKRSEYRIWKNMVQRCQNKNLPCADRYVNRGIRVCDKWRGSFQAFFDDVGPRPTPRHSIDRINNDGDYEPGNVRWATMSEQVRNSTTAILVTINEVTKPLPDWADDYGIPLKVVRERIRESGWEPLRALTHPVKQQKKKAVKDGDS